MSLIVKYALTAFWVVVISEVARKNDRLGALIASLPLMTLLVLFWLFVEGQPTAKIANHAFYTFWYVLGSLPFFLIFPLLLSVLHFIPALLVSAMISLVVFVVYALVLARFGIILIR